MLTRGRETTSLHAAIDLKALTVKYEQLKTTNENLEKELRAEFATQGAQGEHRDEISRL